MDSRAKVAVFTDTNLGTHIATDVSPEITAGDFKRALERAHLNCFPELGEIMVNGLMVKRKSCLYNLPESLPLKHAFQGLNGAWCIYMEACCLSGSDKSDLSERLAEEFRDQKSNSSELPNALEHKNWFSSAHNLNENCKRKKRRMKRNPCMKAVLQVILRNVLLKRKKRKRVKNSHFLHRHTIKGLEKCQLDVNGGGTAKERNLFSLRTDVKRYEQWNSSALLETPSEALSEALSVSGIIKKYFSDYEEVTLSSNFTSRSNQTQTGEQLMTAADDNWSEAKVSATPQFTPKTPPRMLPFPLPTGVRSETSRDISKGTAVGKRLVVASNKLRISAGVQKSANGVCRLREKKLQISTSSTLCRSIVF